MTATPDRNATHVSWACQGSLVGKSRSQRRMPSPYPMPSCPAPASSPAPFRTEAGTRGEDRLVLARGVGDRGERHVVLGGEPRGQLRRALGPPATDDDRRSRPLYRLGHRRRVDQLVLVATVGVARPVRRG